MRYRARALIPPGLPAMVVHVPQHPDLAAHGHEGFAELVLVAAGRARHRQPGGEAPLAAGDLLIVPPEGRHGYAATDGLALLNVILSPRACAEVLAELPRLRAALADAPVHRQRLFPPRELASLAGLLRGVAEAAAGRATGWRVRCRGLLWMAFADIDTALARPTHADLLVAAVQARMERTLDRRLPLASFGVPERTLLRRFAAATGTTPAAWHRQLRAEHAARLRAGGRSAEEAARAAGFTGASHLARQ